MSGPKINGPFSTDGALHKTYRSDLFRERQSGREVVMNAEIAAIAAPSAPIIEVPRNRVWTFAVVSLVLIVTTSWTALLGYGLFQLVALAL